MALRTRTLSTVTAEPDAEPVASPANAPVSAAPASAAASLPDAFFSYSNILAPIATVLLDSHNTLTTERDSLPRSDPKRYDRANLINEMWNVYYDIHRGASDLDSHLHTARIYLAILADISAERAEKESTMLGITSGGTGYLRDGIHALDNQASSLMSNRSYFRNNLVDNGTGRELVVRPSDPLNARLLSYGFTVDPMQFLSLEDLIGRHEMVNDKRILTGMEASIPKVRRLVPGKVHECMSRIRRGLERAAYVAELPPVPVLPDPVSLLNIVS